MRRAVECGYTDVTEQTVRTLCSLYDSYGFSKYKMSKFEEYSLYSDNRDFLISDSVITFTDSGKLMALKPDVTLSIIKNCDVKKDFVQKLYYNEKVYRASRNSGAFSEITQTGLECIGEIDLYTVCEVLSLAAKSLAFVGKEYVLDLGHVAILTQALDACGIDHPARSEFVSLISNKNLHELRSLCEKKGVSEKNAERLSLFVTGTGEAKTALSKIKKAFDKEIDGVLFSELETAAGYAKQQGGRVRIDFSVVTDTKYYDGIVFKGYIKGLADSVLSGGRYGRLVRSMGKDADALGFAVYVDEIARSLYEPKGFDADIALVYDDSVPLSSLREAGEKYRSLYGRVIFEKSLPDYFRAKKIVDLRGKDGKK